MNKRFGALSSSEDPQKLAASVTGSIVACASLIVFFAGHLGFSVNVEQVTNFAGLLGTAAGAIWAVFGVIRKIVIAVQQKLSV